MSQPNFFMRVRRLGLASLTALFGGGGILVFVGLNASLGPNPEDIETASETPFTHESDRMFRVLAYHIGYQFGLVEINVWSNIVIDPRLLKLSPLPPLEVDNTFLGPWAIDEGWNNQDKYFVAQLDLPQGPGDPPSQAVMVGTLDCQAISESLSLDLGVLSSREIVMVANLTNDEGPFEMTRDHDGWMRARTSNRYWFAEDDGQYRAVVDYRIVQPGNVQIQWARDGSWLSDDDKSEGASKSAPVVRRVTYNISYAVAMVAREVNYIDHGDCASAFDAEILSVDSNPLTTDSKHGSLPHIWTWVDTMMGLEESDVNDGVTFLLQAVMAGWASPVLDDARGLKIGLIKEDTKPFGPEKAASWEGLPKLGREGHPFYSGLRSAVYRGCNLDAACIFLVFGSLAIIIGLVRIRCGPCDVTGEPDQGGYVAVDGDEEIKEKQNIPVAECE
ncbi:hypothetical protein G7Z17_g261 [Cylindrodendrum hubeiense]|uniref:Uncharacterized protein n=1 Tax=Cylindrodendrum hubeiense TaxID=595255 RepID=A0A9P5HI47_9HYPO|nr:hypothetical protein G7Z17_g261 [Cylindrodendrum hubeiense]